MGSLVKTGLLSILLLGGVLSCSNDKTLEAFPDRYVGIGVELRMEAAGAHVVRVLSKSGAEASGLKSGDVILQANGLPLRGKALAEVVDVLRGKAETVIPLLVRSKKGENEVKVTRQPLQM